MKKIFSLIMVFSLVLVSCETEPLGKDELNATEVKGKKDKVKSNDALSNDCVVNLTPSLPELVNACTTAKGMDANFAYFDLEISDTSLQGSFGAWCVDVDLSLNGNQCFEANVYSSYGVLPAGKFENPQNFDLINWILNQNFIGLASPSGGNYTFGDVQWAIWELIDDGNCVSCSFLGDDWSEAKGQEIVNKALAEGEGFEPGAGQYLAVVLVPTNNLQSIFIPYLLECEPEPTCETAFARDIDGENCFLDNGFSRWGWSIQISEAGEYSYNIYAGAGQCDINKGELVGTVDVIYDENGNVDVTYNISDGYTVSETHTYAGYDRFPSKNGKPTVAPGQYTINENLSGEIFVIAHAVVCD